jgi:hypothetical protein
VQCQAHDGLRGNALDKPNFESDCPNGVRHIAVPCLGISWLLATLAATSEAQPTVVLERRAAVMRETLSQIRGVRELSDGRVIISDWIEQRLIITDSSLARPRDIGRIGAGPGEYRLPAGLLPMAADSTLLVDMGNARLAVIAPTGVITRSISPARPGMGAPGGIDAAGRIYYTVPAWSRETSALPADSVELFRRDQRTGRDERLAVVKGITMARPPGGVRSSPGFPMVAFAPQDVWAVSPSGTLIVVRSGDYRVQSISSTGIRGGPSYREPTDPVRPADRTAFVRAFVGSAPTSGKGTDGGLGHSPAMSEAEINQMVETNEFAKDLPLFDRMLLAPDGEIWVQRGRHDGEAASYDRFNESGVRVGRVRLQPSRIARAVSQRYVYVVAADSNGIETLERYPRPH